MGGDLRCPNQDLLLKQIGGSPLGTWVLHFAQTQVAKIAFFIAENGTGSAR